MYKYLVAFVLSMPLIGIWMVEHGEFAASIGVPGEPNGATAAFATYVAVVAVVAVVCGGGYSGRRRFAPGLRAAPAGPQQSLEYPDRAFVFFSKNLMLLNLVFLLVMLFGFGGIKVWLGAMEKGLFRASLGPLGALPYLMTKFAIPALFAYSTVLLTRTTSRRRNRWLWRTNAALVFIVGSTWGFKTTGPFMLLPAFLILSWRLSTLKLMSYLFAFASVLIVFFFWFDAQLMEGVNVLSFLTTRLTVMQGDVAWHVWGLYRAGEPFPSYWPTVLAAAGDRVLAASGISKLDYMEWMSYHYDWMITYLSGAPLENIAAGHSVTATPFAEGVVASGTGGMLLFAIIAGVLVGRTYFYLDRAIETGRSVTAAILSTYFCFHVFSWLNGGAITQLFHISVAVNLLATYLLVKAMTLKRFGTNEEGGQSTTGSDISAVPIPS